MGYEILLFDLDGTLLDFAADEEKSLYELFTSRGFDKPGEIIAVYRQINSALWYMYELGQIDLSEVLNTRFEKTLSLFGRQINGKQWEEEYRNRLGEGITPIGGALEVCKNLSSRHRLFVITNGVRKTQINRLTKSGLISYFEDIFDSQTIGFHKPLTGFFEYVAANISKFDKKKSLIIGDSVHTDILGGIKSGIDTCLCLFEKKGGDASANINGSLIKSTYTVKNLYELYAICDS